jgi:MoxR-like ATPase
MKGRQLLKEVYLDEKIERYILDLVFATRNPGQFKLDKLKDLIGYGASPRATINLAMAARGMALLRRRGYVVPDDVRSIAQDVLRHRIAVSYEAEAEEITSEYIIKEILNRIEVP